MVYSHSHSAALLPSQIIRLGGWIEPSHCGENKSALTILNNFQSPALDDTPDQSGRAGQISRDMQTLAFPFLDVFDRS